MLWFEVGLRTMVVGDGDIVGYFPPPGGAKVMMMGLMVRGSG